MIQREGDGEVGKTSAGEGGYFGFDHSFEILAAVSERWTSGRQEGRGDSL